MRGTAATVSALVGLLLTLACSSEGQVKRSSADEFADALAQEWALKALSVASVSRLADDMFDVYPSAGFTGSDLSYEQRMVLWNGIQPAGVRGSARLGVFLRRAESVIRCPACAFTVAGKPTSRGNRHDANNLFIC